MLQRCVHDYTFGGRRAECDPASYPPSSYAVWSHAVPSSNALSACLRYRRNQRRPLRAHLPVQWRRAPDNCATRPAGAAQAAPGKSDPRRQRGKLEGMLFDLLTLVLAPAMWIGGYVGYRARRPSTRTVRRWLLAAAVLATIACTSSIIGLTADPSGLVGAVFDSAGGFSLLLEGAWFFLATRRGTPKTV